MEPTNLIARNGREESNGYCCHHLYLDRNGQLFANGKKMYVVFQDSRLVGEYDTLREANLAYRRGDLDGFKESEYLGLKSLAGR